MPGPPRRHHLSHHNHHPSHHQLSRRHHPSSRPGERGGPENPDPPPPNPDPPSPLSWPKAIRAVRGWLTPWLALQRWWQAWSNAPPPTELQNLIDAVATGQALNLYTPELTNYR